MKILLLLAFILIAFPVQAKTIDAIKDKKSVGVGEWFTALSPGEHKLICAVSEGVAEISVEASYEKIGFWGIGSYIVSGAKRENNFRVREDEEAKWMRLRVVEMTPSSIISCSVQSDESL